MSKAKIGAVTIGQAPRTDITGDILPMLSPNIKLVEYGALDPFSFEEASKNSRQKDRNQFWFPGCGMDAR